MVAPLADWSEILRGNGYLPQLAQSPFHQGASGQAASGQGFMPENLGSLYANSGPMMQQALGLAGLQQPVSGPPPQPGQNPPPPVHIAPPYNQGGFQISPVELQRQILMALGGGAGGFGLF